MCWSHGSGGLYQLNYMEDIIAQKTPSGKPKYDVIIYLNQNQKTKIEESDFVKIIRSPFDNEEMQLDGKPDLAAAV